MVEIRIEKVGQIPSLFLSLLLVKNGALKEFAGRHVSQRNGAFIMMLSLKKVLLFIHSTNIY